MPTSRNMPNWHRILASCIGTISTVRSPAEAIARLPDMHKSAQSTPERISDTRMPRSESFELATPCASKFLRFRPIVTESILRNPRGSQADSIAGGLAARRRIIRKCNPFSVISWDRVEGVQRQRDERVDPIPLSELIVQQLEAAL